MRKTILAIAASLALFSGSVLAHSHYGSVSQGSSAVAGSISGATTSGNGFAGTYGVANMNAQTTGSVQATHNTARVAGTTSVSGYTESGTLVLGAGAAGSIAGGKAKGKVSGGAYMSSSNEGANAGIDAKSKGKAWSATGSIGTGGGFAVNGFDAYGDAKARGHVHGSNNGTESDVQTSSGASTYTFEGGNAIGNTKAYGYGVGYADAYRTSTD